MFFVSTFDILRKIVSTQKKWQQKRKKKEKVQEEDEEKKNPIQKQQQQIKIVIIRQQNQEESSDKLKLQLLSHAASQRKNIRKLIKENSSKENYNHYSQLSIFYFTKLGTFSLSIIRFSYTSSSSSSSSCFSFFFCLYFFSVPRVLLNSEK